VPSEDDDEGRAVRDWELIRRVIADANQRILDRVTDGTFHEPSFSVLSALLHAPNRRLPMSRLAREAAMTSGGFTRLADRLGSAGLIDRRGSDRDRRVIYASLTPAGLREARRLERRYLAALRDEVLGVLDQNALRLVADALRALDSDALEPELRPATEVPLTDRRRRGTDTNQA
jgi:DNA-binding MarR family transcriptional regulator